MMVNSKKEKRKHITLFYIVYQNLKKRPTRTFLMVFFVFVLTITTYASNLILLSLKQGVNNTVKRLGADLVIVPGDYVSTIQNALFMGEPCTVYFDKDWLDKIKKMEGVEKISSQLFLATLSDSACCDNAIQIIAFDPASDFTIQPWIQKKYRGNLPDDQIVIGNNLSYEPGDTATYYGKEFLVAAKLEKTGMGYDNCVFLNYAAAFKLVKQPIIRNYFALGDHENLISLLSVDVKADYDSEVVAGEITDAYKNEDIAVYTSNKLVKGLTDEIGKFTVYQQLTVYILMIFTIAALVCIFSITIQERRREYGIFRSIGAKRSHLIGFITTEAAIISFLGSVLGSLTAYVLVTVFHTYIMVTFRFPYFQSGGMNALLLGGGCSLISLLIGVVSSLIAAVKIGRKQTFLLIQENE